MRQFSRVVLGVVSAAGLSAPAQAQQPAPAAAPAAAAAPYVMPPADTLLWADIGTHARARATELSAGRPPENARAQAQYREALGQIERSRFDSAGVTLQALLVRAPNNAQYQGDFAYTLARFGAFEDAGNIYTRAFQLQQTNAWYIAGIAAAKAAQRLWVDAAGTIQLAAQTDSAVVDGIVTTAAVAWFEQAGDRANALIWARMATARNPDEPMTWLRIATYLRARQDSTPEGLAAIRRFRSMRPEDKLGAALYGDYLYEAGQKDSALALMEYAAQDTTYREFAAQLYLQLGRELVQRRQSDSAMALFNRGQVFATAAQRPAFNNLLGRAQLMKVNTTLEAYSENRACGPARLADSLINDAERNLRAGIAFDSARTASFLESIVPPTKQNAQAAVRGCRDAPVTPARPARPPARPAGRPTQRP